MKLIVSFIFMSFSHVLFAGDFEIVKDGTTYSCTEKIASNPSSAVDCINKAKAYPLYFDKTQSMSLCAGAKNISPAECAGLATAYPSYLDKTQAIQLCKLAINNAPANCVNKAVVYPAYLNKIESVELCSGTKDNAPVDCFNSAIGYPSYLSKAEALQICKAEKIISVGGVEFVQRNSFLNSLQVFKNKFKLF